MMGLFDGYFDPEQFQDSGGLLGRLLSLQQQQGQYQSGQGFGVPSNTATTPSQPTPVPLPMPRPVVPQTPDEGARHTIAIGGYQMPQFGSVDTSQPVEPQPAFGDRLSAGFQSWAHTPVGNPFAALANGVSAFGSGQRTDPTGIALSESSQTAAQTADLGDRISSGFQSWAHTPVGNPFAAVANGISGFSSGQHSDPAAVAHPILKSQIDAAGNPPSDLHAKYQALRPMLGDRNAMLAIVDPEYRQSLMTQALVGQTKPGDSGEARPADGDTPGLGQGTTPTPGDQPLSLAPPNAARKPSGYAARGGGAMVPRSNMPRAVVRSMLDADLHKRGLLK